MALRRFILLLVGDDFVYIIWYFRFHYKIPLILKYLVKIINSTVGSFIYLDLDSSHWSGVIMNYDRNGLPTFETIVTKKPEYSKVFWGFCAAVVLVVWFVV
jgi:hypothetical protein